MIDWSKERTTENYCGYCDSPYICSCDGSCFTRPDWDTKKSKILHLKKELSEIPELKKKLKIREKDLKDELQKINNS